MDKKEEEKLAREQHEFCTNWESVSPIKRRIDRLREEDEYDENEEWSADYMQGYEDAMRKYNSPYERGYCDAIRDIISQNPNSFYDLMAKGLFKLNIIC